MKHGPQTTYRLGALCMGACLLLGLYLPAQAASKAPPVDDTSIEPSANISYLLIASSKGDLATVKALLKSGANPNVTDSEKITPIMYAARKNQAAVITELLANGADINAKDQGGWTALMFAAKKK